MENCKQNNLKNKLNSPFKLKVNEYTIFTVIEICTGLYNQESI